MTTHQTKRSLAPPAPPHSASSPTPSGRLQAGTKVQVGQYVVQIQKFLSEGGFAHVYVASLVSPSSVQGFSASQNQFVLKRMAVPDKAGLVEVRKEVDVMKQLRPHKHIVYFIEASASSIPGSAGYEIFILMEWCPGGGIIDLLNSRLQNRLTESEILKIFSDTVEAVAHMHSQNPILIHRDLKVENILVASPNLYKLCDFGSTTSPLPSPPRTSAEIMSLEVDLNKHTTLQYRAPEMVDVWSRRGVTEKADIWALGVFLYKLCYYTTPFEALGPLAIVNVQYQIPSYPSYSNSIKYLIGTMLQELAQSRPDVWEVHEHVCKLRGLTPHLLRPKKKPIPSDLPDSLVTSNPCPQQPPNNTTEDNGLDSIFTATPASSTQTRQKIETVVPMRRGRPTTKAKPIAGITTSNDNSFFEPANSTTVASNIVTSKNITPPEESDLVAREVAAGFGDDFLSPSPQFTSFKPTTHKAQGIIETHLPVKFSQSQLKPLAPKPQISRSQKTEASSAFDDIVPSRKKTPPKTLNEIRNNLPNVNSAATGPASVTSKSSTLALPFTTPNMNRQSLSVGIGKLSQKTGPQYLSSSVQQSTAYRQISITQKTGPAIGSGASPVIPQAKPSLSSWLEKDRAKSVSRSTQTSPSLLKSLVFELTPCASLNILNCNKSDNLSVDVSNRKDLVDLGSDHTIPANPEIVDRRPRAHEAFSQDLPKPSPKSKINLNDAKSLPTVGTPPVEFKSNQRHFRAQRRTSVASDSDEEPEDPVGQKEYRAQGQSTVSSNNISMLKPLGETNLAELSKHNTEQASARILVDDRELNETRGSSPSSSVTQLSSSEAMTEEDEETKLKRRAAIAKFAPSAKAGDPKPVSNQTSRDPFSSHAISRSVSPEPSNLPTMKISGNTKRQVVPPLRAPKPQSLKSAAAINNLVSRYENLAANTIDSSASIGFKRRQSTFKPIPNTSNPTDEKVNHSVTKTAIGSNTSLSKSPVHIPKKSLGPGVVLLSQLKESSNSMGVNFSDNQDQEGENEGERFTSVNDMKSKWESGAVQSSQHPKDRRLLRTDYGQS